jgi:transposase
MESIFSVCAGLDVHKMTVVACVRRRDGSGKTRSQTRTFGTTTGELLALSEWLSGSGVTHVAMESTGVYWKPIWNILEGQFEILLVNAQHIKQVPGRKTDVKDAEWIAQLLQHGLLRGSFVPPRAQRELRELTRQRRKLIQANAAVRNRIQKVLEDANIKLSSVATDVLGVSGRAMLERMIAGETEPAVMAQQARGRLRRKLPELEQALRGRMTEHHRFLLRLLLDDLTGREALVARLTERIQSVMSEATREAVKRLTTIPGIDDRSAEAIVAEIGAELTVFASAAQMASWAGMCSGNDESAGKRRSGKTTKGNRWLREMLVQSAWAASRTKDTYLAAQFRRLMSRRGTKRAAVAVAHSLLVVIYHLLKRKTIYSELGADYFDRLNQTRLTRGLVRRLEQLGHRVTLQPAAAAAV